MEKTRSQAARRRRASAAHRKTCRIASGVTEKDGFISRSEILRAGRPYSFGGGRDQSEEKEEDEVARADPLPVPPKVLRTFLLLVNLNLSYHGLVSIPLFAATISSLSYPLSIMPYALVSSAPLWPRCTLHQETHPVIIWIG